MLEAGESVVDAENQRSFAEIEVTPDAILIRRPMSDAVAADMLGKVFSLLLTIADGLANARSPWDGEDIDGEAAFFGVTSSVAETIRSAVGSAQAKDRNAK
jgi:hypothetical protein